jgi:hypothetical protein
MAGKAPPKYRQSRRSGPLPWVISAVAGVGLAVLLVSGRSREARHPEPRANAEDAGAGVMPPSMFSYSPRIMQAYQAARAVPATLDGLYCYCQCNEHMGHRSLLICFHSQHGAGCDVCIDEAVQAHEMVQQGRTLADIRAAIDVAFAR